MSERVIKAITPLVLFILGVGLEIYAINAKVQKDTDIVVAGLISAAATMYDGSGGSKDNNKPSN